MAATTTISEETRKRFAWAMGNNRLARDILSNVEDHANAVRLRLDHRLKPWASISAWPSKFTRRGLPGMSTDSQTMRRDAGIRSCAVNRDEAADILNGVLFDLIMEGTA